MPTFSVQVNVIVNAENADEAKQFVQDGIDYALDGVFDAVIAEQDAAKTNDMGGVQSASIGEVEVV